MGATGLPTERMSGSQFVTLGGQTAKKLAFTCTQI